MCATRAVNWHIVQWITCDIREFPFELLGEFGVVMADPPCVVICVLCVTLLLI
jgi:hypothetical protein